MTNTRRTHDQHMIPTRPTHTINLRCWRKYPRKGEKNGHHPIKWEFEIILHRLLTFIPNCAQEQKCCLFKKNPAILG